MSETESKERELTEQEEAILAEAKPETEAEAIAALATASEASKWEKMFDKPKKAEVRQCHNCGHLVKTKCQNSGQVVKPNGHCSAWSN